VCLGIPGQVIEMVEGYGDQLCWVDVVGARRKVNIGMLDDAEQATLSAGDWVLIHMGFIVARIDEAGAERAMSGLELMGRARDTPDPEDQLVADFLADSSARRHGAPAGESLPRVG
jgi:hydrogenase expression/formation protein HypC